MKKIGLLILLAVFLAGCNPFKSAIDIAQAKNISETTHTNQHTTTIAQTATRGLNDISHWQFLILGLLVLFLVVPLILVVFVIIRCLVLWKHYIWRISSRPWIGALDNHWVKADGPDLYQQIRLDQQWLFSQLLSQNQEETDQPELPIDWWN